MKKKISVKFCVGARGHVLAGFPDMLGLEGYFCYIIAGGRLTPTYVERLGDARDATDEESGPLREMLCRDYDVHIWPEPREGGAR